MKWHPMRKKHNKKNFSINLINGYMHFIKHLFISDLLATLTIHRMQGKINKKVFLLVLFCYFQVRMERNTGLRMKVPKSYHNFTNNIYVISLYLLFTNPFLWKEKPFIPSKNNKGWYCEFNCSLLPFIPLSL